jgi:hypothetical protein
VDKQGAGISGKDAKKTERDNKKPKEVIVPEKT